MVRIGIELPGNLVELIDRQAKADGHSSRNAVIRKVLLSFFVQSPTGGCSVAKDPTAAKTEAVSIGLELPDELLARIDKEAAKDGHSNRNAVIRKSLNYFFAR